MLSQDSKIFLVALRKCITYRGSQILAERNEWDTLLNSAYKNAVKKLLQEIVFYYGSKKVCTRHWTDWTLQQLLKQIKFWIVLNIVTNQLALDF